MKTEIKKRWVAALTSGDYAQGKGTLNRHNTFCCLGVLCDLYAKDHNETWKVDEVEGDVHYLHTSPGGNNLFGYPSEEVKEWAGLSNTDTMMLANRNDMGYSFHSIAALIATL